MSIIKKTKSRELTLTAGDGYLEVAERHFGRYLEKATYGVTLRSNVVELWKEEEGGRRVVIRTEHLSDDETKWVRDAMLRVKNFTSFGTLFFYLLHLRNKLERRI
jgi:hypothetical protein